MLNYLNHKMASLKKISVLSALTVSIVLLGNGLQAKANCGANAHCSGAALNDGSCACQCDSGYEKGGSSNNDPCTDKNECTNDPTICGTGGTCSNTPAGSYTCFCPDGYGGGKATRCAAINLGDTCTTDIDCSLIGNATCDDTNVCSCDDGFEPDGSGVCQVGCTETCDANAACTGTDQNFACTCNSGYTGNGTVCSVTGGAIGVSNGFSIFLPAFLMVLSAIFLS